jgi:peroxiredoxin
VVIPSELAVAQNWGFGVSCRIMTKEIMPQFPAMPDEIKNAPIERQKTWRKDFLKSDAGKAYRAAVENAQKKMHTYPLQISQDGTFHADGVAAGTYTLSVDIARKSGDSTCGSGDSIAAGSAEFTVPEMPGGRSDEPLEIPPVSMQIIKTVNVGDAAPDFSAKTLDGRDLKLADFRGKYVLLDFWATWCEPCVVEIPSVKAAYDAFGQSDRFVMISLSLDEKADDAAQYVKKNNLAWNQVFLPGQWEAATVKDYCVHGIPSIWLIGPDGKVIAKDLRGPAIRAAVESALGSKR